MCSFVRFLRLIFFSSKISLFSEAEKLCTKCAEKFSQESLSIKLLAAQIPLLITSLEVRILIEYFFDNQ
jgi:hypothetical protein